MSDIFLLEGRHSSSALLCGEKTGVLMTDEMRTRWGLVSSRKRDAVSRIMQHRYRLLFTALTNIPHGCVFLTMGVREQEKVLEIPRTVACVVFQDDRRVVTLHRTYDHKEYSDVFSWGQEEHVPREQMLCWGAEEWEQFFLGIMKRHMLARRPRSHKLRVRTYSAVGQPEDRVALG